MAKTTADVLFERLTEWGMDTVFGLPGDGINGFMEGLRKIRDRIRFIQVRHEETASLHGLRLGQVFTGRLGVCIATRGPGCHPPSQRPLRCKDGRCACPGPLPGRLITT